MNKGKTFKTRLTRILKYPFYPILVSIFPAISLFAYNIDELRVGELALPLFVSLLIGFLIWSFLNLFIRPYRVSAVIASVVIMSFFCYGAFIDLVKDIDFFYDIANRAYFAIYFILTATVLILIPIIRRHPNFTTTVLNLIAIFILLSPVFNIVYKGVYRQTRPVDLPGDISFLNSNKIDKALPDIYYIISDRYAGRMILKDYFNFDNSQFIEQLKSKGFIIAKSRSNYPFTAPSLASSLNMKYLNDLSEVMDKDSTDSTPIFNALENNEVVGYLKSRGYHYYHFGNWYWPTARNIHADYNYVYWEDKLNLTQFSRMLLNQTAYFPLSTIIRTHQFQNLTKNEAERVRHFDIALDQIEQIKKTVNKEGPKFIFVHSLLTHDPYVFDENGVLVSEEIAKSTPVKEAYLKQLQYANKELLNLIDTIIKESKTPPIIILQSDEGPYPEDSLVNVDKFKWHEASADDLRQKFGIVNAYFLPGQTETVIHNFISPVNSFRLVFNLYFGEDLPLLEDKSYTWRDKNHPYDLKDVTAEVQR